MSFRHVLIIVSSSHILFLCNFGWLAFIQWNCISITHYTSGSSYAGHQESLLSVVKRRNRHVIHHDTLSKLVLQGTGEGGWRRGCRENSGMITLELGGCYSSSHVCVTEDRVVAVSDY